MAVRSHGARSPLYWFGIRIYHVFRNLGYNARRGNSKILHTVLRENCGIETDRRGCLPAARIIKGTGHCLNHAASFVHPCSTTLNVTGVNLVKEILAIKTDTPIIMCTGFSDVVDADSAKAVDIKAFAMKPLTKGEIAKTVRKVLDE